MSDLSNLANASLYGFEDYHGVDIGVVRAVRLWYSPLEGEVPVEIRIKDSDTKLGFAISRTEEVSSLFFHILFINNIQTGGHIKASYEMQLIENVLKFVYVLFPLVVKIYDYLVSTSKVEATMENSSLLGLYFGISLAFYDH